MSGKTYLVTGAGRDIGQAIAARLAAPGDYLIAHYSTSDIGARETVATFEAAGGSGIALKADFSDGAAVGQFIEEVGDRLGDRTIDAIVLNAAVTAATPIGNTPVEALEAMLAANVLAPQRIVDGLSPRIADNGAILALSISSIRQVFSPDFAFFSATKAAVDVLIRAWAVAFGDRGIRANSLAPGVTEANFRADLLKDDDFRAGLHAATALGRHGQIADVADAAALLLSKDARWITGQVIDASGGWKL